MVLFKKSYHKASDDGSEWDIYNPTIEKTSDNVVDLSEKQFRKQRSALGVFRKNDTFAVKRR